MSSTCTTFSLVPTRSSRKSGRRSHPASSAAFSRASWPRSRRMPRAPRRAALTPPPPATRPLAACSKRGASGTRGARRTPGAARRRLLPSPRLPSPSRCPRIRCPMCKLLRGPLPWRRRPQPRGTRSVGVALPPPSPRLLQRWCLQGSLRYRHQDQWRSRLGHQAPPSARAARGLQRLGMAAAAAAAAAASVMPALVLRLLATSAVAASLPRPPICRRSHLLRAAHRACLPRSRRFGRAAAAAAAAALATAALVLRPAEASVVTALLPKPSGCRCSPRRLGKPHDARLIRWRHLAQPDCCGLPPPVVSPLRLQHHFQAACQRWPSTLDHRPQRAPASKAHQPPHTRHGPLRPPGRASTPRAYPKSAAAHAPCHL